MLIGVALITTASCSDPDDEITTTTFDRLLKPSDLELKIYDKTNIKAKMDFVNVPDYLPSYDFTNELIEQAMKDNKMIIIMREKNRWLKRINGLASYHNLYTLKSPQCGYLTLKNIVRIDKNGIEHHLSENEVKKRRHF